MLGARMACLSHFKKRLYFAGGPYDVSLAEKERSVASSALTDVKGYVDSAFMNKFQKLEEHGKTEVATDTGGADIADFLREEEVVIEKCFKMDDDDDEDDVVNGYVLAVNSAARQAVDLMHIYVEKNHKPDDSQYVLLLKLKDPYDSTQIFENDEKRDEFNRVYQSRKRQFYFNKLKEKKTNFNRKYKENKISIEEIGKKADELVDIFMKNEEKYMKFEIDKRKKFEELLISP